MRPIDADALLNAYEDIDWYTVLETGGLMSGSTGSDNPVIHYYDGEEVIKNAPTIDAVPVVRCKDCKYHNRAPCPMRLSLNWTENNDFCSYGERKEGAE